SCGAPKRKGVPRSTAGVPIARLAAGPIGEINRPARRLARRLAAIRVVRGLSGNRGTITARAIRGLRASGRTAAPSPNRATNPVVRGPSGKKNRVIRVVRGLSGKTNRVRVRVVRGLSGKTNRVRVRVVRGLSGKTNR